MIISKRYLVLTDKILLVLFFLSSISLLVVRHLELMDLTGLFLLALVLYNLSFLASYFMSRLFSKRLIDIIFKVEELAAGNFSKKLKVSNNDEISQLSYAINELMSRLNTGVAQDVSKHQEISRAKTDFVAIASHQLRTPLSIIKWYVDFVIAGDAGSINEEQQKYLKEVYDSNERLIELVNALLDVSRIDLGTFSIEPEPTDIIHKADSAIAKFEKEIKEKKLVIEKKYDIIPKVNLDPRLTKILFENILSNSVKYTPKHGKIQVVVRKTEKDVLIKISDSGCGIPREQQPKIFTKMFRAQNAKKIESVGNGLGLYISKAIIEKSGGKIWFQSPSFDLLLDPENKDSKLPIDKQNQGTTFFVTIPLKGMKKKTGTKRLSSVE